MNWNHYYSAQGGGGDYVAFKGTPYQLGYGSTTRLQEGRGLGGLFKRFFSFISPIIKKAAHYVKEGAKEIGRQALYKVADMATEIAQGKNVSDVAKDTFEQTVGDIKTGVRNVGKEAINTVANIAKDVGNNLSFQDAATEQISRAAENLSNKLKGQGIKRKKKFKKYVILKKQKQKDIFD